MLVDDDPNDNFFHEREIKKISPEYIVVAKRSAREALDYLKTFENTDEEPDPIFLDINMQLVSGWDFLKEYAEFDVKIRSRTIIIILTTSENPDDEARARALGLVTDYIVKPLTRGKMQFVIDKYFV